MTWISVIFIWISEQIVVIFTGLMALFTGLYWWNTRRAFLLELDRVFLWFKLGKDVTDEKADKLIDEAAYDEVYGDKRINKIIDEATLRPNQLDREKLKSQVQEKLRQQMRLIIRKEMREKMLIDEIVSYEAFLNTLKSKNLAVRIKKWEKQKKLVLNMEKRKREREAQ